MLKSELDEIHEVITRTMREPNEENLSDYETMAINQVTRLYFEVRRLGYALEEMQREALRKKVTFEENR